MAVRIAEHPDVLLPCASLLDGFIITHTVERAEMLPDDAVLKFVGKYNAAHPLLKVEEPVTMGAMDFHDFYYEHKRQQLLAMENAREVARQVSKEYGELSGRHYDLIETYRMEDAEVAAVLVGSSAGTVRSVADELRKQGIKAGVVRIRLFRPFPVEELAQALASVKSIAVLERAVAFGAPSHPLTEDVVAVLQMKGLRPRVRTYVYGLGGRDTSPALFRGAYEALLKAPEDVDALPQVTYLGVRSK
jgi:pyruvate ferredoxin oxidoreductase alpha subunit